MTVEPYSAWEPQRGPKATAVLRATAGVIFVSEGIQKFLFPDDLGIGRFTKIEIPMPSLMP